jgi:hypothetical protein
MLVFAWILWSVYTLSFVISIIAAIVCIAKGGEVKITLGTIIAIAMYVFLNIYVFAR